MSKYAQQFGYETREASAVPWEDVPEQNKALMIAVAEEVVVPLAARLAAVETDLKAADAEVVRQQELWTEQSVLIGALRAERDEARQARERLEQRIAVIVEVLESCLPDVEGYDDDTEQVLGNVIASLRAALPVPARPRPDAR